MAYNTDYIPKQNDVTQVNQRMIYTEGKTDMNMKTVLKESLNHAITCGM